MQVTKTFFLGQSLYCLGYYPRKKLVVLSLRQSSNNDTIS
jgi:hypothetical protein